jgi:hypothetical protein
LPRVHELIDVLSGAKYFAALDLTSGYDNQFTLASSDVPKTACNTNLDNYEWKVLPMGLYNAPAVFHAEMNQFFGPHHNECVCTIWMISYLIFSKTAEEDFQHMRLVVNILKRNDRKAKLSKCDFSNSKLECLGHIVSAAGMQPDPSKVAVVSDWPVPKNVYEERSFLGLTNSFRKYNRAYAAMAPPLTDLLKGLHKQETRGKLANVRKLLQLRESNCNSSLPPGGLQHVRIRLIF